MLDPKAGDRFHEMYSHWVYVVKVGWIYVWILSASTPCEFPKDGVLEKRTKKNFVKYYSYKHHNLSDRYWIELCDRGNNVKGWIHKKWII